MSRPAYPWRPVAGGWDLHTAWPEIGYVTFTKVDRDWILCVRRIMHRLGPRASLSDAERALDELRRGGAA